MSCVRPMLIAMLSLSFAGAIAAADPAPPSLQDHARFPVRPIPASTAPRELPMATDGTFRLPRTITIEGVDVPFPDALERSGTAAWIVLHRGRIVDERYFGERNADTEFALFSVAKSFLGALAAIARTRAEAPEISADAGPLLASTFGPRYRCGRIRWEMLLDMRSGIAFSEVYDDGKSDVARLYLTDDLDTEAAAYRCSPGRSFRYASIDSQWLGVALETAVGQTLDRQLSDRLWQPMGAAAPASWSTDTKGRIKGFCCLNARVRDLARFGLLVAEGGQRDGVSVLPKAWIDGLLERARNGETYADQWWLLHDREARSGGTALLARGILGQFVFVHPEAQIVIVRIGEREGQIPWLPLFGGIVDANFEPPAPNAAAAY